VLRSSCNNRSMQLNQKCCTLSCTTLGFPSTRTIYSHDQQVLRMFPSHVSIYRYSCSGYCMKNGLPLDQYYEGPHHHLAGFPCMMLGSFALQSLRGKPVENKHSPESRALMRRRYRLLWIRIRVRHRAFASPICCLEPMAGFFPIPSNHVGDHEPPKRLTAQNIQHQLITLRLLLLTHATKFKVTEKPRIREVGSPGLMVDPITNHRGQ
jgi:hypothetical protein